MERRTALITAAATSLTLLAGAAAIGINTQLVDAGGNDGAGRISPIGLTESPGGTIRVDDPAVTGGGHDDDLYDDLYDDERYHDEDDAPDAPGHDSEDDGEHEYEGADDDD
jgi:hypothetical protein